MSKSALLNLLVVTFAAFAPTSSADAQDFLNASAWDVEYEVSFKASSQGQYESLHGTCDYTTLLDQWYSAAMTLDMRNAGPSISMIQTSMVQDPSKLSLAEQQKYAMDMVAKVDHTANWMCGGVLSADQSGSDEEQMAAIQAYATATNGTAKLEYLQIVKGDNLHDETGAPYKSVERTRYSGSGKVSMGDQVKFELDAKAKTYLLMLYPTFLDPSSSSVKVVDSTQIERLGEAPHNTVEVSEVNLERCPGLVTVDDSSKASGQAVLLDGTFDPSADKITGEHTLKAHYSGFQGDIPGTLVVRYTLTPKP